jgi:DNA-binding NtrC family response regulator
MHHSTELVSVVHQFSSCDAITCPVQVLVIDRVNGPANVLIDTISLLLDQEISVTSVEEHADALRALDYYQFDLVVVGLYHDRPAQLAILPHIRDEHPDRPILAVGRHLPPLLEQYARNFGARDVIEIPERAADLKKLVACVTEKYLQPV